MCLVSIYFRLHLTGLAMSLLSMMRFYQNSIVVQLLYTITAILLFLREFDTLYFNTLETTNAPQPEKMAINKPPQICTW